MLDRQHSTEEVGEYMDRLCLLVRKYPPSMLTGYRRLRAHCLPPNSSWFRKLRGFSYFLMNHWKLPNLWMVFILAPFRIARRIYCKYFQTGRAKAAAALGLTR
jgi:hypothetical protein